MPFFECDIRVTFYAKDHEDAQRIAETVADEATHADYASVYAKAGDVYPNRNQPTKAELMCDV